MMGHVNLAPNHKLRRLLEDRELNVAAMVEWPYSKTGRHLELLERHIVWATEQRNEMAIACLEEFRRQIVTARCRKLDAEQ